MKREYVIRRGRDAAEIARLDNHMWPENDYAPQVTARIFLEDTGLRVEFRTVEPIIRATFTEPNSPVCLDSCVEFFVKLLPDVSAKYMNFEINPLGCMLIGFGENRETSVLLDDDRAQFRISCEIAPDRASWTAAYTIPFDFIEKHYGAKFAPQDGRRLEANLYKCGDDTAKPHYWVWNPIDWPVPDYHRPEYFGDMIVKL